MAGIPFWDPFVQKEGSGESREVAESEARTFRDRFLDAGTGPKDALILGVQGEGGVQGDQRSAVGLLDRVETRLVQCDIAVENPQLAVQLRGDTSDVFVCGVATADAFEFP